MSMSVETTTNKGILHRLTNSKVAANVLLLLMFMAGFWGLNKINTQFFPSFELELVSVITPWVGANAEDVERLITNEIEEGLINLDNVDKVTSSSARGVSAITVTFNEDVDMTKALEDVKQAIDQLDNLPADAEKPTVSQVLPYETIASITIDSGNMDILELRHVAREIEQELLDLGVDKIDFVGYPDIEVIIELSLEQLRSYGLTLSEVRRQIVLASVDSPIGSAANAESGVDLRIIQQRRNPIDFGHLPIRLPNQRFINLSDISNIRYQLVDDSFVLLRNNQAAIKIDAKRLESSSSLAAAEILKQWQANEAGKYQQRVNIELHDRRWELLEQRIGLLIKNGVGGLLLVILVLLLFINFRTAFWVAMGIPASLMLTVAVFYLMGGSINMISLLAFILTLGIIVDDAIVVGENAMYRFEQGASAVDAAVGATKRMFFPVLASSLTTVAAFLPLISLSGTIGKFLVTIPIVAICVILASLVECFTVLPGHLNHSLGKLTSKKSATSKSADLAFREKFDRLFSTFQEVYFRKLVILATRNRLLVLVIALSFIVVTVSLIRTGKVGFTFFPVIEGNTLKLDASFVAGTPQKVVKDYIAKANQALIETEQSLGGGLMVYSEQGISKTSGGSLGVNFGYVSVELIDGDQRSVSNREFVRAWKKRLPKVAGLENLVVGATRGGPRGKDLAFQLYGRDLDQLKTAAEALAVELKNLPGVSGVGDDLPYGKEQLVMNLTPLAHSLDISVQDIGNQIRNAFTGIVAQTYTDEKDDVDVRIRLDSAQRNNLGVLDDFQIRLNNGEYAPLANLIDWSSRRGFEVVRHYNGRASVSVFADVNDDIASSAELMPSLTSAVLPRIARDFNVNWEVEGSAKNQARTFADMRLGLMIGLGLIYVILVWVFGSWGWPLLILVIVPFGLVGATFGHLFLGSKLTILSMLGMFGLSGIVINDSIIMVTTFRELIQKGIEANQALIDAACLRLRAVILTSLTTILGLVPLLFETSLQAQFLIPIAITITFGIGFATMIILVLLPVLLSLYEDVLGRFRSWRVQREGSDLSNKSLPL